MEAPGTGRSPRCNWNGFTSSTVGRGRSSCAPSNRRRCRRATRSSSSRPTRRSRNRRCGIGERTPLAFGLSRQRVEDKGQDGNTKELKTPQRSRRQIYLALPASQSNRQTWAVAAAINVPLAFSCFRVSLLVACGTDPERVGLYLSVNGKRNELRRCSDRPDRDDDELLPSRKIGHRNAALVCRKLELGDDVAGLLIVSPQHPAA